MTEEQINICKALGSVNYLPASFDKRIGKNLAAMAVSFPDKELTAKQDEWMYRLLYKYRRQIPITYDRYGMHQYCARLT